MKTQIAITAAALAVAGSAQAALQVTSTYATWSGGVAGFTAPIVKGDLLYGTGTGTSGSGSSASAGTWGLQFNVASDTNSMGWTSSTVVVGVAGGLQTLTFTFPSGGTFPVRGFGFYYTGGTGSPFNIGVAVNSNVLANQTIATGSNNFLGFYQDTPADPAITSVTLFVSSGNGFTMTGSAFALVPAPGAVALLGVAGLVGSRRRR